MPTVAWDSRHGVDRTTTQPHSAQQCCQCSTDRAVKPARPLLCATTQKVPAPLWNDSEALQHSIGIAIEVVITEAHAVQAKQKTQLRCRSSSSKQKGIYMSEPPAVIKT